MLTPRLFCALIVVVVAFPLSAFSGDRNALIDVGELIELRQDTAIKIIEIVAPHRTAPSVHIAGAQVTHFKEDGWVIDYPGLPGMLPPPDGLAKLGAHLGLRPTDLIVLVPVDSDIHGYAAATRAFWTLRMMGHQKLHLLNGGLEAYLSFGAPLSETAAAPNPGAPYTEDTATDQWLTDSGNVYAGDDYQTAPLDIRPSDHSAGYITHPLVNSPGTIYGAFNVPPLAFLRDGAFRPVQTLHAMMDDVIGKPPGPIVVFSDTSYRAAIGWFAIREVMGHKDVRLYDGGYVEWEDLGYETYDSRNDMGDALG